MKKDEIKDAIVNKLKSLGLPAPDQLVTEIQRLNNNLEEFGPSLKKLDAFLDGTSAKELLEQLNQFLPK